MRILGIDISSKSTGWALIESDKLVEFGKINPTGKMTSAQKLCLFGIELKKIIEKHKPDNIAIEDVVQVKSVSVVKILARFNGVAIVEAYRFLQRDPTLFEPTKWKKMIDDCSGSSKKCEIQLAICKKYNLLSKEKIKLYQKRIDEAKEELKNIDTKEIKAEIKQLKKDLKKAKKNKDNIEEISNKINVMTNELNIKRKQGKKQLNTTFDKISLDIYTETSINEDIADSIGVAIAFQKNAS